MVKVSIILDFKYTPNIDSTCIIMKPLYVKASQNGESVNNQVEICKFAKKLSLFNC